MVASVKTKKVVSSKTKKTVVRKKPAAKTVKKEEEPKISLKTVKKILESSHKQIPENYIKDLGELAKVLETDPSIIKSIREVFDYHLVDPLDRKTFPRIVNAMSMLLGSKVAMVVILACHMNAPAFFDDLNHATRNNQKVREAIGVIKYLASIYGDRILRAYTLSAGTVDEDWNSLDINTYKREGDDPLWFIDLKIALYNGVESNIKMVPNSAFQFIGILMKELLDKVPSDQIDPELIENYRDIVSAFNGQFYFDDGKEKNNNHPEGYA